MRTVRTLLTAATAVLVAAAATPQAFAAAPEIDNASGIPSHVCNVSAVDSNGTFCFRKDGDYFYLQGGNSGVRVVGQWKLSDGSRKGFIRWTPTDRYTWGVANKNLPEQLNVSFRFGICYAGQGCDTAADAQWLTGWKTSSID